MSLHIKMFKPVTLYISFYEAGKQFLKQEALYARLEISRYTAWG